MKQLGVIISLAIGLLFSPACSCDGDGEVPDSGVPDPDAPVNQLRQVTGSDVRGFIGDGGETTLETDLSGATIEALVDDDAGGYTVIAGVGNANGTFTIDDVPTGEYILRVDTRYRVLTSSTIDLGFDRVGRADAVPAITSPTDLTFGVTGMNAFALGDRLDFFAPNASASEFGMETTLVPEPAVDDVAIASTIDWTNALENNLIDSNAGDVAYLLHYGGQVVGLENYSVLTESLELPPFTMTDGAASTLAGAFVDTTLDQTVAVGFNPEDWALAFADIGPTDLIEPSPSITLFISPFGINKGDLSFIELASYSPGQGDQLHAFDLAYANPFPGTWTPYETAFAISVGFVDPQNTTFGVGFVSVSDQAGALFGNVIPRLGPVGAPMADGADLAAPQAGTATPTVSWTAPAVGTAESYSVNVREVGAGGNQGLSVATISTSDTSVTLPAGILESGKTYYFQISALSDPSTDYETAPFRTTGPIHASSRRPTSVYTVE